MYRVPDSTGSVGTSFHHQRYVVDLDPERPASANTGDTCWSDESKVWYTWTEGDWASGGAGVIDPAFGSIWLQFK